jgi:hypothetical protein
MRNFIGYMEEKHDTALLPLFTIKALSRTASAKTVKQRGWIPFTADEGSRLHQAALDKNDQALADLIGFGAYSRYRIEGLAQVKTEHISDSSFKVVDSGLM